MTVRKKESGESFEVFPGTGTKTFRTALFVLVISMHPLGRQILGTIGFKFPDEQKVAVVADKAAEANSDVKALKDDVKDLKEGLIGQRASSAITNAKIDDLARLIGGFKIDLEDVRKHIDFSVKTEPPR